MSRIKKYFKAQNIEFSFDRIVVKGLGGMAQGLFASLLIGTIIKTIGGFIPGDGAFRQGLLDAAGFASQVQGSAMALAIGYSMQCPPYVMYSLAAVGAAAVKFGGGGGPLAVYAVSLFAIFFGKLVSKRTPVDLLVTPVVTILSGVLFAEMAAPPIGYIAVAVGNFIMWATTIEPFWMGILVSALMGTALTLPISSAAICAALGLVGYAGGAALAGCCAHMVGFAICAYRDNKAGGLMSVGIGTSMLLFPNLVKKPLLWIPPTVAAAITGPLATCVFKTVQNGAAVSSGMGTCGLVGPISAVTGWLSPSEAAISAGFGAIAPTAFDVVGLIVVCFVAPAVISWAVCALMRRLGWIKDGDYKIM